MTRSVLSVTAMTGLALFFLGCSSKKDEAPGKEATEQSYKVDPDASVRIANPHGSVTILGTDGSQVQMRSVKSAANAAQLENISVSVTAEPGDVLIKTTFLPQKNMPFLAGGGRVDFTLSVPRTARIPRLDADDGKVTIDGIQGGDINANVVNGELAIRNCCGNMKVSVGNGALDLAYGACEGSRFSADVQVLQGNVRLGLVPGASFRIRGETKEGKILNNLAARVELNGRPSRQVDLSLVARPRCEITVRVTSGDIVIDAAKPGS